MKALRKFGDWLYWRDAGLGAGIKEPRSFFYWTGMVMWAIAEKREARRNRRK